VEVKYCENIRSRSQLEAALQQHSALSLCQHILQTANISLHTILLGVGGTIYSPYSTEPLKNLGLDPQQAMTLAKKTERKKLR